MNTYIIDLETCARQGIEDTFYVNWARKKGAKDDVDALHRAGLHPEFGMICCCGIMQYNPSGKSDDYWILTAQDQEDECEMLKDIAKNLEDDCILVGHNIKRFDVPYLVKAFLRHNIVVPKFLRPSAESQWVDTMNILAMGGSQMSLRAACLNMGIKDSKSKVCGDNIYDLFLEGKMDEISEYNYQDLVATHAVYHKIRTLGMLD